MKSQIADFSRRLRASSKDTIGFFYYAGHGVQAEGRNYLLPLAQIDAPTGSFISYATAPGKVALDGDTINSPFTAALAKALPTSAMPIEQIFKRVRVDVIRATYEKQIPWDSCSLIEDLVLQPEEPESNNIESVALPAQTEPEIALWNSVKGTGDPDLISLFLQKNPNSPVAQEARKRIKHPYGGFCKSALRVWAAAECP